jgi:hypothetical protein
MVLRSALSGIHLMIANHLNQLRWIQDELEPYESNERLRSDLLVNNFLKITMQR